MSTYQTRTASAPASSPTRRLLLAGVVGGAIMAVTAFTTLALRMTSDVDDSLWRWPWTAAAFPLVQAVWVSAHALIIAGLLGLGRSRALLVAMAGSALLLTGELASLAVAESTDFPVVVGSLYTLGALLAGIGLVAAGRRTRVAGVWALAGVVLTMTPVGYAAVGIWGVLLLVTFLRARGAASDAQDH